MPSEEANLRMHEAQGADQHRAGKPLSVVVFVTTPIGLALLWSSVCRQTYRPLEFLVMNQARDPENMQAVKQAFSVLPKREGISLSYLAGNSRIRAVRRAKHDTLLLLEQGTQLEPGHIASLLHAEQAHKKRAVSSLLALGNPGGYDTAKPILVTPRSMPKSVRMGMFLMRKKEIGQAARAAGANQRLSSSFLEEYWKRFISRSSRGTLLPTLVTS